MEYKTLVSNEEAQNSEDSLKFVAQKIVAAVTEAGASASGCSSAIAKAKNPLKLAE